MPSPAVPTAAAPAPTQPPPTATATPRACQSGQGAILSVLSAPHSVAGGATLTVGLRAAVHARVTALLRVTRTTAQISGKGKHRHRTMNTTLLYATALQMMRDRHGRVTARAGVNYRPAEAIAATLTLTARDGCGATTRTLALTIQPPRRPALTLGALPASVRSGGTLALGVHTVPSARVSITLQVTDPRPVVTGRGKQQGHIARRLVLYQVSLAGTANAQGVFSGRVHVAYRPTKPARALVTVTARMAQGSSMQTEYVLILPRR